MKINVHIERVILDGVPADHLRLVAQGIEKELTLRLMNDGISPEARKAGAVAYGSGSEIEIGRKSYPATLGAQVGGAVYRVIGGGK
jgi:hypothetical protein